MYFKFRHGWRVSGLLAFFCWSTWAAQGASSPSITTQPVSQTNIVGANVTFTSAASGTPTLYYHWTFNGSNLTNSTHIGGATNATLTVSNIVAGDAGNYQVVVTNSHGSATSAVATLTFVGPTAVTVQPQNLTTNGGANVVLSANVSGLPADSYQWQFNGANLVGATNASLILSNVLDNQSGLYDLVVSNALGKTTSSNATLNVIPWVVPSISPNPITLGQGQLLIWGLSAGGFSGNATYQWYQNGNNMGSFWLFTAVTEVAEWRDPPASVAGSYYIVGSDSYMTVTSPVVTLTVNVPAAIDVQPTNQTVFASSNAVFFVGASGTAPLHYQWFFNGAPLSNSVKVSGATNASLVVNNVQAADTGNYQVVVTNSFGSVTSSIATLALGTPPVITAQPQGRIVFVGAQYSLSGAASGTQPIAYQWLFNGAPISNATNTTLFLTNLQLGQSGNYSLQASNGAGVAVSSNANVVVTATPDCTSPPSGLVGWWRGEGNANDVTGTNNGALSSSGASYASGFVGQAFRFDGVNGYVQIPDSAALRPANITVEAWVWLDPARTNPATESIVFKKNSWSAWFEGYSLCKQSFDNGNGTYTDRFMFVVSRSGSQIGINSATVVQRGIWYHVAATFDGTTTKLYVNGVLEGTATPGFALDYDTTPVFIGTTGTWSPYLSMFAGIIDEPTIYNRALSSNEVAAIYYSGNTGKCLPPSAPVVVTQPANKTVVAGSSVTFTAIATGVPVPSYQWYFNGIALTNDARHGGVTSSNLTLVNLLAGDAGNYFVVATNFMGSVTSSVATLTVIFPPVIVSQPQDQTVLVGGQATFNVTTAGTTPMWYQLLLNGVAVPGMYGSGGTNYSFVLGSLQGSQQGTYSILVTNNYGSVMSSNANLTVLTPPAIVQQPANLTAQFGAAAAFSVIATGTAPLNYQWTFNGTNLVGATNATLLFSNLQPVLAGNYAVAVSNSIGSATSSNAVLAVNLPLAGVPFITGFNPASAIPGSTVTITGTNFSPVAASNTVFFGATRASVVSASATNLLVIVPTGATFAPITETVNGLMACSSAQFLPTFLGNNTPINSGTFSARQNLATPSGPMQTVIADLDGDGKPDLVVADIYAHTLSLFQNVSTPGSLDTNSFAPRVDFPVIGGSSDNPIGLTVADVDGDGRLDILICDRSANQVKIYRNISTPGPLTTNSFAAPLALSTSSDARHLRVADIDGDGRSDIIVADWGADLISIFRNIGAPGSPAFAPRVDFAAGAGTYDLTIVDLDGDGRPDIAWSNPGGPNIAIMRNVSVPGTIDANSFTAATNFTVLADTESIVAVDVDGDGKRDLIVGSVQGDAVTVLRNQSLPGNFSFAAHVDFGAPGWVHDVTAADFNGDGQPDLNLDGELNSYLAVFQNGSVPGSFTAGSLSNRVDFATGWNAWGISAGDLDGDGRPDVVLANSYDNNISLYQNLTPFGGPPVILTQSGNQTAPLNNTIQLSASVAGQSPLSWRWYFNGTNLTDGGRVAGSSSSTLTITNAQLSDSGNYYFVVTNSLGAVTGAVATVSVVVLPPAFAQQPQNQQLLLGSNAAFTANVTGSYPISFQWFNDNGVLSDGGRISGSMTVTLAITNAQTNDAVNYWLVASNIAGTATSSVVNLSIVTPVVITQPPSDQTVAVGSQFTLTVAATGTGPLGYQWYFNGASLADGGRISGSATGSLNITNVQAGDAGNYTVTVTNSLTAATSSVAVVSVLAPPSVSVQPAGRSAPLGWPTAFSATFAGSAPLTYQWQLNGVDIPGATNASYSIAAIGTNDLGNYHLVASNTVGVATSADAKLTFGNVAAWGRNISGESLPPPDLTNAFAVAGSFGASFAARTDGSLVPWGSATPASYPSRATNVIAIASGIGTVVLRADGTTVAWDYSYLAPTVSNVVAVAAGNNFGFALRAEGTLVPWGFTPYTNYPAGLNHVIAVACGYGHSLALKSDGTVEAWGDSTKSGAINVPVNLTNVVGIAAGSSHSLALKNDGTVVAWGTGIGTNLPAGLTNVAAIFAGYTSSQSVSLAVRSNGTVVVWGDNGFGETNPPVALANLKSVTGAGAANHAMTVLNDGSPLIIRPPVGLTTFVGRDVTLRATAVGVAPLSYQWLWNSNVIAGATSPTLTISNVQTANAGSYQLVVSNALNVAVSLPAPLTVISNNTLTFLSGPGIGQTNYPGNKITLGVAVAGNGPLQYQWYFSPTNNSFYPTGFTPVPGATNDLLVLDPAAVAQSGNYFVAVSNQFGGIISMNLQYLPGSITPSAVVKVQFARAWGITLTASNPLVNVTNAIAIATGTYSYGHYLALGADGKLKSWAGYSPVYYNETNVSALTNYFVTAIAAGYMDSLALKSDGTVYAWGFNQYGATNPPVGLANVTAIACGDYHDLALKSDGTVVGWGQNTYGQATNYSGATNVVAIAAGSQHSLALRMDGTVAAWGYNGYGQTNVPLTATNVIAIACGAYHSLALRANGTVIGWGNNGNGQTTIPANATNIVAIAAGGLHSTLLRADGTVIMLGVVGQTTAANYIPAGLANVISVVGGGDHDFGLLGTRAPAFATQPYSRNVFRGTASAVLAGKVSGVQPMTYQWRFNGANIVNATNDTLTLVNLQFTNSGAYQLVASNSYGVTTSKVAKLTVTLPLGTSLNANNYAWTSTGGAVWFGQTNVTHDGVDAVQSGGIGALQETILQATVATNWSGRYTFWWKVSSEAFFDTLEFRINGISQTSISGEQDWQQISIPVAAGTNVLQWRYSKDANGSAGQDAGWVDQFAFVPDPPIITLQPAPTNQTVNLGANVNYFIRASGGTMSYQWLRNGSNNIGGSSSSITLNNVGRAQNGNYFVIVNNGGGSVTSSVVNLKVLVPQLLGTPSLAPDGSLILNSADANGGLLTPADLANFEAQASTNLVDWQTSTNGLSLTNGLLQLQDADASSHVTRFYRIIEH